MKVHTTLSARTYEMHGGEWREVESQPKPRERWLLRGLGALAATARLLTAIAAIGIFVTAVALLVWPIALFALWLESHKRRSK